MIYTVTEYADEIDRSRKSARQRLDVLVRRGLATKVTVTELVRSNRWGRECRVLTTFDRYTVREST